MGDLKMLSKLFVSCIPRDSVVEVYTVPLDSLFANILQYIYETQDQCYDTSNRVYNYDNDFL